MHLNTANTGCSVRALTGVNAIESDNDAARFIEYVFNEGQVYSQIVFSDVVRYWKKKSRTKGGRYLANYIEKHDLGHIIASAPRVSGSHGYDENTIQTWVWAPRRTLNPHMKKLGITLKPRIKQPEWY